MLLGAGGLQDKLGEVAVENGQLLHLLFGEERGHVSAISLQLRRFSSDFNRGFGDAYLELAIGAGRDVGGDRNRLEFQLFESSGLHANIVSARNQVSDAVVAGVVGGSSIRCALTLRSDRHLGVGNRGPGLIGDGAENTAVNRLSGRLIG